ncbi:MFS transporter (plasmid) [Streptomyces sp. CG4]|uniref:MFS transporter n=1 Tax=Streptomyces sp. CG4 TaxID=408783 RepID=UPI0034E1A878
MLSSSTRPPHRCGRHRRPHAHRPWKTLVAVCLGTMMVTLNTTAVAIANPAIAREYHAGLAKLEWVTNSYLLVLAFTLVPAGRLGDRRGHRGVFLAGIVGFSLTSLTIALAPDIGSMVGLRALQGLFGALLQPSGLGLLRSAFPGHRIGAALGVRGMSMAASTAAGPIVAGLLVEVSGWRSVFLLNVPIGACALVVGAGALRGTTPSAGDPRSLPLPGTSLFRSNAFRVGTVLTALTSFVMIGALFFFTLYLQNVLGESPVQTGLRLLPLTVAMIIASLLAGWALRHVGRSTLIVASLTVTAAALLGLGLWGVGHGSWAGAPWLALLGAGLAPAFVVATHLIVRDGPAQSIGMASGMQQTAVQLGAIAGTALLGTVLSHVIDAVLPDRLHGVQTATIPREQLDLAHQEIASGTVPRLSGIPLPLLEGITRQCFESALTLILKVSALIALATSALGFAVRNCRCVAEHCECGARRLYTRPRRNRRDPSRAGR